MIENGNRNKFNCCHTEFTICDICDFDWSIWKQAIEINKFSCCLNFRFGDEIGVCVHKTGNKMTVKAILCRIVNGLFSVIFQSIFFFIFFLFSFLFSVLYEIKHFKTKLYSSYVILFDYLSISHFRCATLFEPGDTDRIEKIVINAGALKL